MNADRRLAEYFGVAPEILPFVPDLLQDFWELGSDPALVVSWLGDEGIGSGSRVLDLGCGKGAVAIELAGRLGCEVYGVDALPPFVEEARQVAKTRRLDHLCRFEVGDLREAVHRSRGHDAVLLVSVGVLGSPRDMVAACRECVVPGGLMVLDDCFRRAEGQVSFPGYEELQPHAETVQQLTYHGDTLLRERITPLREMRRQNQRYQRWIEARAEELAARHPIHAADLRAYVERERAEARVLETAVGCAVWMLRRAGSVTTEAGPPEPAVEAVSR